MSVNLNSNIIKAVQPFVNREPVSYNFPADVFALGAGGGGEGGFGGAGGGGGGALVSASISVVPNITWAINVGGGGASNTDGQDTYATVYNDTYAGITTLKAQGGRTGNLGNGGNSGTGSLITPSGTFNYTGKTGGAVVVGGGRTYGGGGATGVNNGGIGIVQDGNPGTNVAGDGGRGIIATIGQIAGGGGGAGTLDSAPGSGYDGGGNGGAGATNVSGSNAIGYGAGGGAGKNAGPGGSGSTGLFYIQFVGKVGTQLGEYDIAVTNGTISGPGEYGITTILFNSGSGTFRYTAPYPYVPGN